jgi:VWFA-related protein
MDHSHAKSRWLQLSLVVLTAGCAKASARETAPTFTSEVQLVTVDAVVLDKEGHAVAGLTRDDFIVEEDGKPREIDSFEPFVQKAQAAVPVAPGPVASNAAPPPVTGRAFALVLDDMSMENTEAVNTRRAVSTVLEKTLHDGDEVILATSSGDAWWTARLPEGREDLLAVVARLRGRNSNEGRVPDWISDYEAFALGNPGILNRVEERFFDANICTRTMPQTCPAIVQERAQQVNGARQDRTRSTLDAVRRAVQALAGIHGRKSVLLFSPGFLEDSSTSARGVEAISREANAAVYFIDVRGLFSAQDDASVKFAAPATEVFHHQVEDTVFASAGAQTLADETGGFSIRNTNDVAGGTARIIDESRVYYLLGFHPAAGRKEGEWRKLRVKVTREGLTVRARRGYTLRAALDQARTGSTRDKKKPKLDPAARALDAPEGAPGIPLRAMTYVFEPRPKKMTHVVVAVEVDTGKITFQPKGHSRIAQLQVTVVAMNRDTGKGFWHDDALTLEVKGSDPPGWRPFAREFELPAGVTQVRIVVRDTASGVIGSVTQRFEVPPPGVLHFATPILSDRLAGGAKPTAHPQPVLVAHRVFAPQGHLYCQFDVFDAATPSHAAPRVAAGLELRKANGQVVLHADPTPIAADSNGRLVRTAGITLAGMEEGSYDLVLEARDQVGGGQIERHEPFTLARSTASP